MSATGRKTSRLAAAAIAIALLITGHAARRPSLARATRAIETIRVSAVAL